MNLDRYPYFTNNDFQEYEFYSEGPKGKIKKIVLFQKAQDDPIIYNLAFGDEDPRTSGLNDSVVSNNNDRNKVLATVASTINDFCDRHGNHYLYAKGSNEARTRLYQMSISALLEEISIDFEVNGILDGEAVKFEKNVKYEGFLIKRI
ncbi:hypothetical protein ACVWYN_002393 [Pedobacter sp. UYP24]